MFQTTNQFFSEDRMYRKGETKRRHHIRISLSFSIYISLSRCPLIDNIMKKHRI